MLWLGEDEQSVWKGGFLVPVLMKGSKTLVWRERKRSRVRGIQNYKWIILGVLGRRRIDRLHNQVT